jgi:hypothetical protein
MVLSGQITIYNIIESPGKAWAHVRGPYFSLISKDALLAACSQMLPKLLMHGEPQEGKPFDIECIYQFTFAGDSTTYRFKAINDFLDSKAFAAMG